MCSFKICLLIVLPLCLVQQVLGNFKAHFPLANKSSYPRLVYGTLPLLSEYTFCSWVRPLRLNVEYPYIFSYATSRSTNELTILLQKTESSILGYVQMGEPFVSFNCHLAEWKVGSWQHVCASWLGADGTTKFYVNGHHCSPTGSDLISPGGYVLGGGVAMLGQDQDEVGSSFEPHQAWYGDMTNANLWNEVLSETQIREAGKCFGKRKEGNVIAWSKTPMRAYDGVYIAETELCEL